MFRYSLKTKTNEGVEVTAPGPSVAVLKVRAEWAGDATKCKEQTIRVWGTWEDSVVEKWVRVSRDGIWSKWEKA